MRLCVVRSMWVCGGGRMDGWWRDVLYDWRCFLLGWHGGEYWRNFKHTHSCEDLLSLSLCVCVRVCRPKKQVRATVNACSAAPLTAMMNRVCWCVMLRNEIATSAGREHDKVGALLRERQAALSEGGRGERKEVGRRRKWSQRLEWETFVGGYSVR